MARPRIALDLNRVEQLAALGCSNAQIADIMDCPESAIQRAIKRDSSLAERVRAGRTAVRTQILTELVRRALKGSDDLLITALDRIVAPKPQNHSSPDGDQRCHVPYVGPVAERV